MSPVSTPKVPSVKFWKLMVTARHRESQLAQTTTDKNLAPYHIQTHFNDVTHETDF